jgi:tRNA (guanine37-N1)-methyltransferase
MVGVVDKVSRTVVVLGLRVKKTTSNSFMNKKLKDLLLGWKGTRSILPDPRGDVSVRLVLLNPERFPPPSLEEALPNASQVLKRFYEAGLEQGGFDEEVDVVSHQIVFGPTQMTAQEILQQILPAGIEIPKSFETIGHIAHLNLKEEHEPFKEAIGEVILLKNSSIKTVVNKVRQIENQFRVFKMEVLAGDSNLETVVKEHGCVFHLDYGKVYWNSRLLTEHQRLVKTYFNPGQLVADVFCGIGPFAIPAARKGTEVLANDLNPESFRYLEINVKENKVESLITCFNMDARAFVRHVQNRPVKHFVMNYPAYAPEFLGTRSFHDFLTGLDAFSDWNVIDAKDKIQSIHSAMIHCYCFSASPSEAEDLVSRHLPRRPQNFETHLVRNVAPKKDMFCVSFLIEKKYQVEEVGQPTRRERSISLEEQETSKKSKLE